MGIFKACDIRGVYREEWDEKDAYKIGKALGVKLSGKKVIVGGDARKSTPAIKTALIQALLESGCKILDIGIAATPVFYFGKKALQSYGGVMVTASHNPAEYNGFKIALGDWPVTEEDMEELENLTLKGESKKGKGSIEQIDILNKYKKEMVSKIGKIKTPLKAVVDGGNGVAGAITVELLQNIGCEVIPLYCNPDGNFPNRDPNPAVYKNIEDLTIKVKEEKADIGIALDGDGDRVVFVDEKGRVITSEKSFILFIQYKYRNIKKSMPIIYDLKSSAIVPEYIKKVGGLPIAEKSGHAFIKRRFLEKQALMAGEISGHFFFNELGGDDGIYGSMLMAKIVSEMDEPLSKVVDEIPSYHITPDIRVKMDKLKGKNMLERVKEVFSKYDIDTLDGVKVNFSDGWGLIRLSVTEPKVTLRFEGKTKYALDKIIERFEIVLPELKPYLKRGLI